MLGWRHRNDPATGRHSSTSSRTLRAALTLASAAALLLACGSDEPTPTPASSPGSAAATAASPSSLAGASLPKDVPTYPGALITARGEIGGAGQLIGMQAKGTPEEVLAFYREQLPAENWKIEGTHSTADGAMVIATQGPRQVTVLAAPDGANVEISVTLMSDEAQGNAD